MKTFTIKVSDAKYDDFKEGILKAIGTRPPELEGLTDVQFLKQWLANVLINQYKTGKIMIAKEETKPTIDLSILTVE